ncbi:MAG: hypothetical protein R2932_48520 [Caldilineaceae bacterium]
MPTPTSTPGQVNDPGWVSGVVYDSSTYNEHLIQCAPLSGVRITLVTVDVAKLTQVRAARKAAIAASNFSQPLPPSQIDSVAVPVPGEVTTDANGAFIFLWLKPARTG